MGRIGFRRWPLVAAGWTCASLLSSRRGAHVERILTHIGEPPRPPPITTARSPPAWEDARGPMPDRDILGQPEPEPVFEFDQRVAW